MLFLTNFVFTSCNLQNHAIVSWIILGARFDRGSPQNLVYIKHYCQLAGCRFKWKGESDISFHRCHSHGDCHPWFPPGCLTGFFIRGCASTAQAWHYDNHRRKWVTGHGNCWKLLKNEHSFVFSMCPSEWSYKNRVYMFPPIFSNWFPG